MIKQYTEMSEEELLQEKAKIEMLLVSKQPTKQVSSNLDLLYSCIDDCIFKHLSSHAPPLHLIRSKPIFRELGWMLIMLDSWLEEITSKKPTRLERLKTYTLACDLISKFILDHNIVLSLTSILHYQNMFPGVVENAFPGYIESGLARYILNAKIQHVEEEDLI
jgi:hypothetical protein